MAASNDADAGAAIDLLLEEKQSQLKTAKRTNLGTSILKGGTGAVAGFAAGFSVVVAGVFAQSMAIFKNLVNKHPDLMKRMDKASEEYARSGKTHFTPEMEKTVSEFTNKFMHAMEHEGSNFGRTIIKNPNPLLLGLTAAGAGLGLLWEMRVRGQKAVAIEKDVGKLEQIKHSWQERIVPKDEKPAEITL